MFEALSRNDVTVAEKHLQRVVEVLVQHTTCESELQRSREEQIRLQSELDEVHVEHAVQSVFEERLSRLEEFFSTKQEELEQAAQAIQQWFAAQQALTFRVNEGEQALRDQEEQKRALFRELAELLQRAGDGDSAAQHRYLERQPDVAALMTRIDDELAELRRQYNEFQIVAPKKELEQQEIERRLRVTVALREQHAALRTQLEALSDDPRALWEKSVQESQPTVPMEAAVSSPQWPESLFTVGTGALLGTLLPCDRFHLKMIKDRESREAHQRLVAHGVDVRWLLDTFSPGEVVSAEIVGDRIAERLGVHPGRKAPYLKVARRIFPGLIECGLCDDDGVLCAASAPAVAALIRHRMGQLAN